LAAETGREAALGSADLTPTAVRELLERQTKRLLFTLHELRRPLTVANAHLDLLMDGALSTPSEAVGAALRETASAIHEMTAMVDGLAAVARLEDGVEGPRRRRCDLWRLVMDAASTVEFAAMSRQVRVELLRGATALEADVDPEQLRTAIVNLLSNAVKHSPAHSPVTVTMRADGTALTIAVSDRGPGIGPADVEHLFEPWYCGSSASAGLGLGLWIVRQIAEWHGGRVIVESAPGRGATFSIVLPWTHPFGDPGMTRAALTS
jgi:signal transduction histidine kinase